MKISIRTNLDVIEQWPELTVIPQIGSHIESMSKRVKLRVCDVVYNNKGNVEIELTMPLFWDSLGKFQEWYRGR